MDALAIEVDLGNPSVLVEVAAKVHHTMTANLPVCCKKSFLQLDLQKNTVHGVLRSILLMFPYRFLRLHMLRFRYKHLRVNFANFFLIT